MLACRSAAQNYYISPKEKNRGAKNVADSPPFPRRKITSTLCRHPAHQRKINLNYLNADSSPTENTESTDYGNAVEPA